MIVTCNVFVYIPENWILIWRERNEKKCQHQINAKMSGFDPLIWVISTLQTSRVVYKQLNVQPGLYFHWIIITTMNWLSRNQSTNWCAHLDNFIFCVLVVINTVAKSMNCNGFNWICKKRTCTPGLRNLGPSVMKQNLRESIKKVDQSRHHYRVHQCGCGLTQLHTIAFVIVILAFGIGILAFLLFFIVIVIRIHWYSHISCICHC